VNIIVIRRVCLICQFLLQVIFTLAQTDPLPSWNKGATKDAIISFVNDVSTEGSDKFVPKEYRIATFDNDGTLWCEKPLIQGLYVGYRVKKMAAKNPALRKKQPYKAILEGDKAYLHKLTEKDLVSLIIQTHTGTSEAEFDQDVREFFNTATDHNGKAMHQLLYQPQLELLQFLRDNGFRVYICSGGTIEFVRAISQEYYGIPSEQVIGTRFKYLYKDSANINDLYRQPAIVSFNDKQEKPVNIRYHIGKRPILACGNEGGGGDIYMLRYSQGNTYPSLQLLVDHDDNERESAYAEKDNKSLNWAKKYGWQVISMKKDWKRIFPE
jgi:hypothetical protein